MQKWIQFHIFTSDGKAPARLFDEHITRGSFPFIAETDIQGRILTMLLNWLMRKR